MTRNVKKRLRDLDRAVHAMPIRLDVERAAFERFRDDGELPDDVRVAAAVVRRCKAGLGDHWETMDDAAFLRWYVTRAPRDDAVLHRLYDEAVWGSVLVRMGALAALRALRRQGHDVTQPVFDGVGLDDVMACAGGVGLWLIGLPERLGLSGLL